MKTLDFNNIDRSLSMKLFENVVLINGKIKSIIFDFQRENIYHIDYDLSEFINSFNGENIFDFITNCQDTFKEDYISIVNYLLSNDLAFVLNSDENEMFPKYDKVFHSSFYIVTAILDIKNNFSHCKISLQDLNAIECQFLELRIFSLDASNFNDLLKVLSSLDFNSVTLKVNCNVIQDWFYEFEPRSLLRIFQMIELYGVTNTNIFSEYHSNLICHSHKLIEERQCGIVNKDLFAINKINYFESMAWNSCLNRKVSIDFEGIIKNCPSMKESFGNIQETTLTEAIEKPGFKKYWDITKDKIHVCKDCEFRYICTDCRAYVENPDDILSKPLKCGYNPYTGEWNEWSTNPLKQKAIDFYGMREMVK